MKAQLVRFITNPKTKKFLFYYLCIFLCYMLFLHPFLTSDHVWRYFATDYQPFEDIMEWIPQGRIGLLIHACIEAVLLPFHITYAQNGFVFILIGMAFYAGAATMLHRLFEPLVGDGIKKRMLDMAVLLAFVNPFMIETYRYKASNFALGVFLAVLAAVLLLKKRWVAGILLGWIASATYLTNVLILLIVCYTFVLLDSYKQQKKPAAWVKQAIQFGACAVLALAINTVLQTVLTSASGAGSEEILKRPSLSGSIVDRIAVAYGSNGALKAVTRNLFGFIPFPNYLPLMLMCVFALIVLYEAGYRKKRVADVVLLGAGYFVLLLIPFSHCLAGGWINERQMLSFFFMLSGMSIITLGIAEGRALGVLKVTLSVFSLIILFATESGVADCYINQAVDVNEARIIQNEIEHYEAETGEQVKLLVTGGPQFELRYFNEGLLVPYNNFVSTHRIMYDEWARGNFINMVNGTDYDMREMTEEEYEEYFGRMPEGGFTPSEQMVFRGDTLFILSY